MFIVYQKVMLFDMMTLPVILEGYSITDIELPGYLDQATLCLCAYYVKQIKMHQ